MELSHVEISVPQGSLTEAYAADLDQLLHDVFGWHGKTEVVPHPSYGPMRARTYVTSERLAFILRESAVPLRPGTEDHLGFVVESDELARLAQDVDAFARRDDRLETRYLDGGEPGGFESGSFVFRTFFVRYLLPVWFQFEARTPRPAR